MVNEDTVALWALGHLGVSYHSIDISADTSAHVKVINRHIQNSLNVFLAYHEWQDYRSFESLSKVNLKPTGTDWDADTAYSADDYALFNGALYKRLVTGTTAGDPLRDTTNWQLVRLEQPNNNYNYAYTYSTDVEVIRRMGVDGYFHKSTVNENDRLRWEEIGPEQVPAWDDDSTYVLNDVVSYGQKIYRNIVAGTDATAPDTATSIWVEVGGLIYSDVQDADIEYTRKVTLTGALTFKHYFARGFAAQLAEDMGPSIITNNFAKVESVLLQKIRNVKNESVALDTGEAPLKQAGASRFTTARWK